MIEKILTYALEWSTPEKRGRAILHFVGGDVKEIDVPDAAELAAIAAVLKESPVGYDTANGTFVTGWDRVGQ